MTVMFELVGENGFANAVRDLAVPKPHTPLNQAVPLSGQPRQGDHRDHWANGDGGKGGEPGARIVDAAG